ncbi:hypothetical protein LZ32DRAFT_258677 [Colletotrichum eremochloae]|nr:hypothetical protein LZ32DRAFT_258677 [Colletotrichum eremochloae]
MLLENAPSHLTGELLCMEAMMTHDLPRKTPVSKTRPLQRAAVESVSLQSPNKYFVQSEVPDWVCQAFLWGNAATAPYSRARRFSYVTTCIRRWPQLSVLISPDFPGVNGGVRVAQVRTDRILVPVDTKDPLRILLRSFRAAGAISQRLPLLPELISSTSIA